MYKHILIAIDGSALANQAVEHGLALAKQDKARVTELWSATDIAHEVRQGRPDPDGRYEEVEAAAAKKILDWAAQRATALGLSCDLVHFVMASHGRRGVSFHIARFRP